MRDASATDSACVVGIASRVSHSEDPEAWSPAIITRFRRIREFPTNCYRSGAQYLTAKRTMSRSTGIHSNPQPFTGCQSPPAPPSLQITAAESGLCPRDQIRKKPERIRTEQTRTERSTSLADSILVRRMGSTSARAFAKARTRLLHTCQPNRHWGPLPRSTSFRGAGRAKFELQSRAGLEKVATAESWRAMFLKKALWIYGENRRNLPYGTRR